MDSKFVSFILNILVILIIAGMTILGINIYKDLKQTKPQVGSYDYVPSLSELETKNLASNVNRLSNSFCNIESTTSQVVVNANYFYDQLNKYSKIIYDGLEKNKINMTTGTYKIEFGNKFSDLLNKSGGDELLKKYYQPAIEAFVYDNPDVFYIDTSKLYLNIQTTTKGNNVTYNVYLDSGKEESYLSKDFSSYTQVSEAIEQVEKVRDEIINNLQGTTYQKILSIHNYLVDNIEYEQTISKNNIYNIYGALVNKTCVCEGYAKAFKYLTNEAQIDSVIVIGTGTNLKNETENHAWNYVCLDNNWYAIDCTWDDPILLGGSLTDKSKYKYFLKGFVSISLDHFARGQFTSNGKVFEYPVLSDSDY